MILSNLQLAPVRVQAAGDTIKIDKSKTFQEIWGFGASANHPVDFLYTKDDAGKTYSDTVKNEILDKLFKTTGDLSTGFSIIRWEINPYLKTDPNVTNRIQPTVHPNAQTWDWDTDYHQKWFANEALERNPDMQFYAVPWSPPEWMMDNTAKTLKPENYDNFANYIATWLDKYSNGVPFSAADPTEYKYNFKWVSVQNEPDLKTGYASCVYDFTKDQIGQVAVKVKNAITEKGLSVKVGAPEGSSRLASEDFLKTMSPESFAKLDFIPVHDYSPSADVKEFAKGLPIINTEVCYLGPSNPEITDGIIEAQSIYKNLVNGEPGYFRWWFVSTGNDGQPLIHINNGDYTTTKRLYTMGQFARFIRPGDYRIEAVSSNSNLSVVATKNAEGNASIVVINDKGEDYQATIDGLSSNVASIYRTSDHEDIACLGNETVSNGKLTYTFPAKSVTTIVEGAADTESTVKEDPKMKRFLQDPNPDPDKLYPTDDAYVRNGTYSDTSYPISTALEVKRQPAGDEPNFARKSFFKFNINSLKVPFESIKFYVKAKDEQNGAIPGLALYATKSKNWSETTLTWNNAPQLEDEVIQTFDIPAGSAYKYYSFDITSLAKESEDGIISLAIMDPAGSNLKALFLSKDNNYTDKPYILVTPSLWPADSTLTASDVTETEMVINWTECKAEDGIKFYSIYKNGELTDTVDGNTFSYNLTGLTPGTDYSLQVRAETNSGRITSDGPVLEIKSGDTTNPTWPADSSLKASDVSATGLTLSWSKANDNAAVTQYDVYQNNVKIGSTTGDIACYEVAGLKPQTEYKFTVKAKDANGNASEDLEVTESTITSNDTVLPTWNKGTTVSISNITNVGAKLTWPAASDNTAVGGYKIYKDGAYIDRTTNTEYNITGLSEKTKYTFKVEAFDTSGNRSMGGPEISFKTSIAADTSAPGWVIVGSTLTPSNVKYDGVTLTWNKFQAIDNKAVTSLRLFNGDKEIATFSSEVTTFDVTALNESTTYTFKIEAGDAAGNWSTTGPVATVTTSAKEDKVAPSWSLDRKLTYSQVTSNSVKLTWSQATDNTGVSAYKIYNGGTLIATVDAKETSYVVNGLEKDTAYSFKVEAGDGFGNLTTTGPAVMVKTFAGAVLLPEVKIYPTDDAFAQAPASLGGAGTTNNLDYLRVKNTLGDANARETGNNRKLYLKFNLSSIDKSVYSATLKMFNYTVQDPSVPLDITVYGAQDNWSETSVNWQNKPADIAKLTTVNIKGNTGNPGWKSFEVTNFVEGERIGDKFATLRLSEDAHKDQNIDFRSKEYSNVAERPYLSVIQQTLPVDTELPTWTNGQLTVAEVKPNSVKLTWSTAADNIGVNGYSIFMDGSEIANVAGDVNSFVVNGLTPDTGYDFKVEAKDADNCSVDGPTASATSAPEDTESPTWPQDAAVTASDVTRNDADITWTQAEDNYGVKEYKIYVDSNVVATVQGDIINYRITNLTPGTSYDVKIEAVDYTGNVTAEGLTTAIATIAADNTAPTWPEGAPIEVSGLSTYGIQITWPSAEDDTQVEGYKILLNNECIAELSSNINSYYINGLESYTIYDIDIKAVDKAGNWSDELSNTATTLLLNDSIAPQWPTGSNVIIIRDGTNITLKWDAATDNVLVEKYIVYRDGTKIAEVVSDKNQYTVTGLTANTPYTFKVEALDGAGYCTNNGPSVYFDGKNEVPTPVETEINTTNSNAAMVINAINTVSSNGTIFVDVTTNKSVAKEIFDTVRGTDKTVTFTQNGIVWSFKGKDISGSTKTIDMTVSTAPLNTTSSGNKSGIAEKVNNENVFVISFANNGQLPGKAKVKVKLDAAWLTGKNKNSINIYYYNEANKAIETIANGLMADAEGYVQFDITHNSDYIVSDKDLTKITVPTPAATVRLGGANRYETSVKVSQAGWATSENVVLARGDEYADALTAAPFAKQLNAPVLLTSNKALDASVTAELKRLKVKKVYIIGGAGAISTAVENAVKTMGMTVERISGSDRYATALAIASKMTNKSQVFLATGANFADALSISSYAAATGSPILLTVKNQMSAGVTKFIKDNNSKVYAIGGIGVIADSLLKNIAGAERISGADRYATNLAILSKFAKGFDLTNIYLATGANYPDAICGSALAGKVNAPIVLINTGNTETQKTYIKSSLEKVIKVNVLGGEGVLSESVVKSLLK
jgi:putative cell wall-binding protein/O-glycosyl hydrolase/chitodextrinase